LRIIKKASATPEDARGSTRGAEAWLCPSHAALSGVIGSSAQAFQAFRHATLTVEPASRRRTSTLKTCVNIEPRHTNRNLLLNILTFEIARAKEPPRFTYEARNLQRKICPEYPHLWLQQHLDLEIGRECTASRKSSPTAIQGEKFLQI
jgi:hypothetical protein